MISELANKKIEVVDYFLRRNVILGSDFLGRMNKNFKEQRFYNWLLSKTNNEIPVYVDYKTIKLINEGKFEGRANSVSSKSIMEMEADRTSTTIIEGGNPIEILFSYDIEPKKKEISDFVYLFNKRYELIKKILMNRQELQGATSIARLIGKKDRNTCSVIGTVLGKSITSNNNIILTLEDQTGTIKVFIGKNKPELFEMAREISLDEVIGIIGTNGDNIIFTNSIILPDTPVHKEVKKAPEKAYAVFLSDLHVGSINFLPEEFNKFLSWIRMETGTEKQKAIASRVKYIFIAGDLVDGVGIYPDQDTELDIKDIYEQYRECARFLKEIPSYINIIICPGNHDALRISEPQPQLNSEFAKALWDMKNVTMVSNPALVNIHSSDGFPGFDVLLYHGYSFDYYVANVDTIREKGGYDRADLIMKFLLQRRHLAPSYTSTLYVADPETDPLVIKKVPDFFVTGHIHKSYVANYRNITMICGSCWQSTTSFQEKVGHNPEPARVPVVDLNTRKVKILRFDK